MSHLPTTRKARWVWRKQRYARRLKRKVHSYPASWENGPGVIVHNKRFGPWEFRRDGRKQQSMWMLLKQPTNSVALINPTAVYVESHVGYKQPPHIYADSVSPLPSHYHSKFCGVGFHNRPMERLGHKLGRMNGYQRKVYWAGIVDLINKLRGGPGGYPPWDPLARQPVIDDPDNWFPRHPHHYHGMPIP